MEKVRKDPEAKFPGICVDSANQSVTLKRLSEALDFLTPSISS